MGPDIDEFERHALAVESCGSYAEAYAYLFLVGDGSTVGRKYITGGVVVDATMFVVCGYQIQIYQYPSGELGVWVPWTWSSV
jgi:hypothetical protein